MGRISDEHLQSVLQDSNLESVWPLTVAKPEGRWFWFSWRSEWLVLSMLGPRMNAPNAEELNYLNVPYNIHHTPASVIQAQS